MPFKASLSRPTFIIFSLAYIKYSQLPLNSFFWLHFLIWSVDDPARLHSGRGRTGSRASLRPLSPTDLLADSFAATRHRHTATDCLFYLVSVFKWRTEAIIIQWRAPWKPINQSIVIACEILGRFFFFFSAVVEQALLCNCLYWVGVANRSRTHTTTHA